MGIQAFVRSWSADHPAQLFKKVVKEQKDEGIDDQTPVEWMQNDAIDGKKDFLEGATIWDEHGGLKEECSHWRMFTHLASPKVAGDLLIPPNGFDFQQYFRSMRNIHEGALKQVWGKWVRREGPPPASRNFWHCQYAKTEPQRELMEELGCRGAKRKKSDPKVDWHQAAPLTKAQMLAIGSTSICGLPNRNFHHHWRRVGYVLSYDRFLCFLVGHRNYSMHAAEAFWKNCNTICQEKGRRMVPSDATKAEAQGRFQKTGAWGHGQGKSPQGKGKSSGSKNWEGKSPQGKGKSKGKQW